MWLLAPLLSTVAVLQTLRAPGKPGIPTGSFDFSLLPLFLKKNEAAE